MVVGVIGWRKDDDPTPPLPVGGMKHTKPEVRACLEAMLELDVGGIPESSPASGTPHLVVCIRSRAAVAEPAGRGLHVVVGGASEAFQEGVGPLRLLVETLVSPFPQSHDHADDPTEKCGWTFRQNTELDILA